MTENTPEPTESVKEDSIRLCEKCGASLVFSPETQQLTCPQCGEIVRDSVEANSDSVVENDLISLLSGSDVHEDPETITLKCPQCGGETVLPENTVSGFCSYCKSPITAQNKCTRSVRPSGILPFAVTRQQAEEKFRVWIRKLFWARSDVKNMNLAEQLKGYYLPLWTFDFNTTCFYTGKRGIYYYVTETREVNGKKETYQVRKTRWTFTSGVVHDSFDDLTVYADNSEISPSLSNSIGPWEIKKSVNYQENMTCGYIEKLYNVPLRDGLAEAKNMSESTIRDSVLCDIGGDEQQILTMKVRYSNLTYKQLLLPFWISHYTFRQKKYLFAVNGNNGTAHGDYPVSFVKVAIAVLLVMALIFFILWYFN